MIVVHLLGVDRQVLRFQSFICLRRVTINQVSGVQAELCAATDKAAGVIGLSFSIKSGVAHRLHLPVTIVELRSRQIHGVG